jgi:sugar phosphate isomerase/epimerase
MKFSLCNEVIADRPFEVQCAFAAACGYDGLEIAPFTLGDDPRDLGDADIAAVRRALDAAGIVATGLHWLLVKPAGLSITTPDDAVRRTTLEVMRRNVELCAELGGSVLVHGSPAQRRIDGDAGARGRAMEIFAAVAETAEACGVTYCLEPLNAGEADFINRVDEAVAVVDEIGSPAFRTMIDTSAAAISDIGPVADLVRRWVPTGNIAHVQFNDRNRRGPGQGADAFTPVLRALRETGYDRVVAMEPFIYEPDRSACAAGAIAYVLGILEALDA